MIKKIEASKIKDFVALRFAVILPELWQKRMKPFLPYILLSLLLLVAVWPLLKTGFFVSDDGEWMVVRLTDFHRSLVSGMFPVRWAAKLVI